MSSEDKRQQIPINYQSLPTKAAKLKTGPRPATFDYFEDENFVLMDDSTYELSALTQTQLGALSRFLKEGQDGIVITYLADCIVKVDLPTTVELMVTSIAPHDSATSSLASSTATLETGAEVTVPSTVEAGQIVRIDTPSGTFAGIA
jgi:elongation factor P